MTKQIDENACCLLRKASKIGIHNSRRNTHPMLHWFNIQFFSNLCQRMNCSTKHWNKHFLETNRKQESRVELPLKLVHRVASREWTRAVFDIPVGVRLAGGKVARLCPWMGDGVKPAISAHSDGSNAQIKCAWSAFQSMAAFDSPKPSANQNPSLDSPNLPPELVSFLAWIWREGWSSGVWFTGIWS